MALRQNTNPICREREAKGLTQVDLARETRRSITTIRYAERGLASPATLRAISRILGVSVERLLGHIEAKS